MTDFKNQASKVAHNSFFTLLKERVRCDLNCLKNQASASSDACPEDLRGDSPVIFLSQAIVSFSCLCVCVCVCAPQEPRPG